MNSVNQHNDIFPLEQLFLRLEVAGFKLSPADKIRALRTVDGPAKGYLDDPEKLKLLLAPVLTRSAKEQLKFYAIFDLYFKSVNRPIQAAAAKGFSAPRWVPWIVLLLAAMLIGYGWFSIWNKTPAKKQAAIHIQGPTEAYVGDTVSYLNLSQFVDDTTSITWKWTYGTPGQDPELVDSTHSNWDFIVPSLVSDIYQKEVRLQLKYHEEDSVYENNQTVIILCAAPPEVKRISGPTKLQAGQNATFVTAMDKALLDITRNRGRETINGPAKNWLFEWDFGDGEKDEGYYFTKHTFKENGLYNVRLTVTDTTLNGFCSTTHYLEVKVGAEKAFLPLATLHKDHQEPLAAWGWAYYLLLALLGIGIVFHWTRWLVKNKKAKQNQNATSPEQEVLHARFELNDKAPYIIPLRDQNQQIQPVAEHLLFADALRLRQTGLRKEIDVAATLYSTINSGGYPSVQFRYATQPSEYLFLIDEQCRASHLGRLFKYLAESLRGQDVLMEVYYYRLHFNRFWNHHHSNGISLEQLQKELPNYRLIVLGDLHELIDPYAKNQLRLRLEYTNTLKQWPQKLLLSPVPPISWSYREKLLSNIFHIFPADVEGIANAALHLENELGVSKIRKDFDLWKEEQTALRHDNDTEHRKWKRWRAIKDYLSAYDPDLTRWFKALSVFPMHSWEMTIAIGRALNIDITYDRLLQLARIPSLQKDRLNERLRQELLADLDPADEKKARQAVRRELDAVKAISSGSAAGRELETSLAIQSFALDPTAKENQDTIRFLLEKGILNSAQEKELDLVSSRSANVTSTKTTSKQSSKSVRAWLNAADFVPETKTKKASRFNKDFWKALLLSLAYLLLLVAGFMLGGSDALYKAVFWESPEKRIVTAQEPLRNYYFVKEELLVDSAVIFNNIGVVRSGEPTVQDTSTAHYFRKAMQEANPILKGGREDFVNKEVSYRLANANLAKLYYNTGVNYLNQYLNDSLGQSVLTESLNLLDKAYINDSIALDVIHAKGVVHYYKGSPADTLQKYYRRLDTLGYFQTIAYSPNLETLLDQQQASRITDVTVNRRAKQGLEVSVDYFLNTSIIPDAYVRIKPTGKGSQPALQNADLEGGPGSLSFVFNPPRRSPGLLSSFLIEFHRRPGNDIIDSKVIAFDHNWSKPKNTRSNNANPISTGEAAQKAIDFQITGTIIGGLNRKELAGVNIYLEEKPNRGITKSSLRLSNASDEYGVFGFEGVFKNGLSTAVTIKLTKTGYKTREINTTAGELIQLNNNGWILRMENAVGQPQMESISGGLFMRSSGNDTYIQKGSRPRKVEVRSFAMGIYEVSYAEYDLFCEMTAREKADDNGWGRGNRPVTNVSWLDAIQYCNWLSEQHNYRPVYRLTPSKSGVEVDINSRANGYRLPTEAEWEYAARGGIMSDQSHIYSGSSNINEVAWYDANSRNQSHPVGQKRPNNAGLYDMSGNVWEWCQDWYAPYPTTPSNNPLGPDFGSHRVIRGGAWIQQAEDCRINLRRENYPDERHSWLGFRLVRKAR